MSAYPTPPAPPIYGLMAEFPDPTSLVLATRRTHEEGYRNIDAYSPFPIEDLAEALGARHTRLPLLVLVGGIFVIEALSVMLQVLSFKWSGRRIFLMAPIHHHFEMKAWSDTKIMLRFWIVGAILGGIAFAVYYNYITDFRT